MKQFANEVAVGDRVVFVSRADGPVPAAVVEVLDRRQGSVRVELNGGQTAHAEFAKDGRLYSWRYEPPPPEAPPRPVQLLDRVLYRCPDDTTRGALVSRVVDEAAGVVDLHVLTFPYAVKEDQNVLGLKFAGGVRYSSKGLGGTWSFPPPASKPRRRPRGSP